jgi:hypothetical protein
LTYERKIQVTRTIREEWLGKQIGNEEELITEHAHHSDL